MQFKSYRIRKRFGLFDAFWRVHRLHETRGGRHSRVDNMIWSGNLQILRKVRNRNLLHVLLKSLTRRLGQWLWTRPQSWCIFHVPHRRLVRLLVLLSLSVTALVFNRVDYLLVTRHLISLLDRLFHLPVGSLTVHIVVFVACVAITTSSVFHAIAVSSTLLLSPSIELF